MTLGTDSFSIWGAVRVPGKQTDLHTTPSCRLHPQFKSLASPGSGDLVMAPDLGFSVKLAMIIEQRKKKKKQYHFLQNIVLLKCPKGSSRQTTHGSARSIRSLSVCVQPPLLSVCPAQASHQFATQAYIGSTQRSILYPEYPLSPTKISQHLYVCL